MCICNVARTEPFLPLDPPSFGDKTGSNTKRPLHAVKLPTEGSWEWELPWKIDTVPGQIGKSMDKDGWDYAFDFGDLFDKSKPPRGKNQTMDCVRRRRWVRTRIGYNPKSTSSQVVHVSPPRSNKSTKDQAQIQVSTSNSQCVVIWDVAVKDDGKKIITLRSAKVVTNQLPYEVKLMLQDGSVLGPLGENESISIPLQKVKFAQKICVQPTKFTNEWSDAIDCSSRPVDFAEQLDVFACIPNATASTSSAPKRVHEYNDHTLPIRTLVTQKKNTMKIELYSPVEIMNALPCAMHFKISRSLEDLKNQNIIDQKVMHAGDKSKLYFVNLKENNFISISLPGPYGWSEPVDIKKPVDKKGRVNVVFHVPSTEGKKEIALLIRLQVQIKAGETSAIVVFSNSAFVDYTGLDIAISSVVDKQTKEKIRRVSYDESEGGSIQQQGSQEENDKSSGPVIISNVVVKSHTSYEAVNNACPGKFVHVDRDFQFTYLPSFLLNQSYIQTAGDDRIVLIEGSSFLKFEVDRSSLVILLLDISATQTPLWLKSEGFHPIMGERVVARGKSFSNHSVELNYTMFGKLFLSSETVTLGCNYSADAQSMYSVFVIPADTTSGVMLPGARDVIAQINHASLCDSQGHSEGAPPSSGVADTSWVAGGHGCTLFNTETGRVVVGLKRGSLWSSQEINLRGLDSSSRKNGPFEVVDNENNTIYQLVYTVHFLPSLFCRTKVLTVMPRYCIVNCMQTPVYIRQWDKKNDLNDDWGDVSSNQFVTTAKPFRTTGWHMKQGNLDTRVQIRLGDSYWCWGYFDINEIGTSQVLLLTDRKKMLREAKEKDRFVLLNKKENDSDSDEGDNFDSDCVGYDSYQGGDEDDNEFQKPLVINVDIKLASSTDKCAVSVIFWTSNDAKSSDLSITNNSKYPITICQEEVLKDIKRTAKKVSGSSNPKDLSLLQRQKQHVTHIPPYVTVPFGWAFPSTSSARKVILVGILTDLSSAFSTKNKVSLDLQGGGNVDKQQLYLSSRAASSPRKSSDVFRASVSVDLHSHGRVINVTGNEGLSSEARLEDDEWLRNMPRQHSARWSNVSMSAMSTMSDLSASALAGLISEEQSGDSVTSGSVDGHLQSESTQQIDQQQVIHLSEAPKSTSKELNFSFNLVSVGLSIIADRPSRRELLSLYLENIKQNISKIDHVLTVELSIFDIQIDNYAETAMYPVMFRKVTVGSRSVDRDKDGEGTDNIPFLQIALLQEKTPEIGTVTFKYLTARVLEFAVEIDSGSILLLLTDVLGKVKFLTPDQALSYANPQQWIAHYNSQITSPIVTRELTNVYQAQCMAKSSRIFFEQLIFHPMKVSLTFLQTDLPKGRDESLTSSNALDTLVSVATVSNMEIRLNSFIVNNAVESMQSLQARIVAKTIQDITRQLALIVGSLQVIGNPANLVSNIGNGVQDFFYEPYQGMVQSPIAFIKGVHKGTSSLVSGVVTGALTSVGALVGTASSGISYLSGDQDFVRQRAMQRQKQQAGRGGALTGMKDGGESIITGFASGISGIVMKPIEGAEQEGALGFFKGVGKGLMGVAVKPVLGVTDGITSMVEGISNEVGNVKTGGYAHIRPSRTFSISQKNVSMFVLSPVRLDAAEGQQFVNKYATKYQVPNGDTFHDIVVIDGVSDVIFSETFIHYRREPESTPEKDRPLHPSKRKCISVPWTCVSYAILHEGKTTTGPKALIGVELSVIHKDPSKSGPFFIPCRSLLVATNIFDLLLRNKEKMQNADMMKDASATTSAPINTSGSSVITSSFTFSASSEVSGPKSIQRGNSTLLNSRHKEFSYQFGEANNTDISGVEGESEVVLSSTEELLAMTQQKLEHAARDNNKESMFDSAIWWLLFHWNQSGFCNMDTKIKKSTVTWFDSVCCAAFLLNRSEKVLYLRRADVILGRSVWVLTNPEFTADQTEGHAETIAEIPPGGHALVFGTAAAASTYESGNLEVNLHFSSSVSDNGCSFRWNISNQVSRCKIHNEYKYSNDTTTCFRAEFLEKTAAENWSKYVVLLTDSS